MAMRKVKSPSNIRLRTTKMMTRHTKPNLGQILKVNQDMRWKSGLQSGTGLDDYRLDVMKLS